MNITVSLQAETLLARLAGTESRLRTGLRSAVERLSIGVQAAVKEDKLSGQVLHVRSGTLRRSINRVVTETPSGVFATVGTNVVYAAIHEYGGATGRNGSVQMPVRSFLRSTLAERETTIRETLRSAGMQAVRP